jgi:hypothetical protein
MELGSMNWPASSRVMLTKMRNCQASRFMWVTQAARACGICSEVSRKLNRMALVMMYSSIDEVLAPCSSTLGMSRKGRLR